MISVKPDYFLLKYTILFLLALSVVYLLNPEVAIAGKASQLTTELKQLEKELETTSKEIATALKNNNEKELANLDSRINDLNSKVDELRGSIDGLPGGGERQKLSDNAKNLWWDVQNLREDTREGNVRAEDFKRNWGPDYDKYKVSLANIENLGNYYTENDQPCDCNLKGIADMLRKLAKEKNEVYDRLGKQAGEGSKLWQDLVKEIRKKTSKMEPDLQGAYINNALTIAFAASMDGLDMALNIGSKKLSETGGVTTIGRKVLQKTLAKAPGKGSAMYGALERAAGKSGAEKFKKMFPTFSKIEENHDKMFAWAGLAKGYTNLENRLWDKMFKNADCLRKIGNRITGKACDLKGISEEELGKTDSFNLAGLAQIRTGEIAKKGRIAWQGCKLCEAFEALKQLKDLKDISQKNIHDLNKGVRTSLNTLFSLNIDLMKFLSRKGPLEGGVGGYYDYISGAVGFAPWGGTAVAVCEGIVDIWDTKIKDDLAGNLRGNMKDVMSGLRQVKEALGKWKEVDTELNAKIKSIWDGLLYNCDLSFDCGDKDEGAKPIPDAVGKANQPDSNWKVNVDESTWCSYWTWETPTGKGPSGGWFTPERPRKPKQPKGSDPKKPGDGKKKDPGKKPKDGEVPLVLETPPPPPTPEEKTNGPSLVFYSEEPEESEETEGDPEADPEEEVDEDVPAEDPPPVLIVKAKRDTLEKGKTVSEGVANAQIKLSFLAPDLPLGDAEKDDKGFDKDPVQGITNEKGELVLKTGSNSLSAENRREQVITSSSRLARFWNLISPGTASVYAAPIEGRSSHKPLKVEINIPKFESHILKININKKRENWDDPATYLGHIMGDFVSRKWIVEKENCMYAVVNIPVAKEGQ